MLSCKHFTNMNVHHSASSVRTAFYLLKLNSPLWRFGNRLPLKSGASINKSSINSVCPGNNNNNDNNYGAWSVCATTEAPENDSVWITSIDVAADDRNKRRLHAVGSTSFLMLPPAAATVTSWSVINRLNRCHKGTMLELLLEPCCPLGVSLSMVLNWTNFN